jgi:hypothetical protein
MTSIVANVEGHGEVSALPVLLRRIGEWQDPLVDAVVLPPIRVRRDRFLNRDDEFNRVLALASAKAGNDGWILVLLDADDDCPAELGADTMRRARERLPNHKVSVVLANREYEAWFIAAAASLNGHRGFAAGDEVVVDAEAIRDAKGWIKARIASGAYGETTDQPAFSARVDLQQVHDGSRSFRKLCLEWRRALA